LTPEQLTQLLDELGQRLGPTGEHVFRIAVGYQITSSMMWVIPGVLLFVLSLVAIPLAFLCARHPGKGGEADWFLMLATGSLLGISGLGLAAFHIPNLLNPEYAALRDILSQVTP